MSAEFRLSDERWRELRHQMYDDPEVTMGELRAVVESIVASEREAAGRALVERMSKLADEFDRLGSPSAARDLRAALTRPDAEGEPDA